MGWKAHIANQSPLNYNGNQLSPLFGANTPYSTLSVETRSSEAGVDSAKEPR